MQYIWLCVLIAAIILEVLTAGLVSIWFVPSALIAMLLAFLNVPTYLQVTVFLGVSIILLVLSRTIWKKYTSVKPLEPTNTDILIGQLAIVTETVDNIKSSGQVYVKGQNWSARTANEEIIEKDTKVRIISIEGVKLICEKAE